MGNRAVITTANEWCDEKGIGVYLHWNGGRDSVEAFLTYCKLQGYVPPEEDNYGWACLAMVVGNFFGCQGLSIGIDTVKCLDCDNGDNGVYIIEDWKIVGRECFRGQEQQIYDLEGMLLEIDEKMPEGAQLGADEIREGLKELMKDEVQD